MRCSDVTGLRIKPFRHFGGILNEICNFLCQDYSRTSGNTLSQIVSNLLTWSDFSNFWFTM